MSTRDDPDYKHDGQPQDGQSGAAERPYRFPPLQEARFEAELTSRRGGRSVSDDPHVKASLEHGLFPDEVREHADGSLDEVYPDGHVEHYTAEEVARAAEARAAREADEALAYGPPAQSLADAVHVEQVPIAWDAPGQGEEEMLEAAGTLLDHLDDLGDEACDELCRLLNAYGASRWGLMPLFEVYRTPDSWQDLVPYPSQDPDYEQADYGRRALGYRLNALEAALLPPSCPDYDSDGPSVPWSSAAGLGVLDRVTEVLADGSAETVEESQILCERGPSLQIHLVSQGRILGRKDLAPLYRALEEGHGRLIKPIPQSTTPLLLSGPYETRATSVASMIEAAKQAMYDDEEGAARDGDGALSDERIAAMERLAQGSSLGSWQLDRIRRQRQGRDRVQECWGAIKECYAHKRALLPAWHYPQSSDELILVCLDHQALAWQLRHYAETHPELALTLEPEVSAAPGSSWDDKPHHPADPSPGHLLFRRFTREAWHDPRYWWSGVDRDELDARRGQWVALDRFHDVIGWGDDPERLKAPGWRHIVSVPDEGYDEGLVITNPEPEDPEPEDPEPEDPEPNVLDEDER